MILDFPYNIKILLAPLKKNVVLTFKSQDAIKKKSNGANPIFVIWVKSDIIKFDYFGFIVLILNVKPNGQLENVWLPFWGLQILLGKDEESFSAEKKIDGTISFVAVQNVVCCWLEILWRNVKSSSYQLNYQAY